MHERRGAAPRGAVECAERERPGFVFLAPPHEPRIERRLEQPLTASDDDSATLNTAVRALLERLPGPVGAAQNSGGRLFGEPVDGQVRDRPGRAELNRPDR